MKEESDDYIDRDIDTYRNLRIFKQSEVLLEIIENIVDGIPLEDTNITTDYDLAMYEHHSHCMMENALLIPNKIAEAHQSDIYDQKMESATLIRKAGIDILKDTQGLYKAGFNEPDYLHVLRDAIEVFRPLFALWIKTFNPNEYILDRWGLFNPPGVHFEDEPITGNVVTDLRAYLGECDDDWDDGNEDDDSLSS